MKRISVSLDDATAAAVARAAGPSVSGWIAALIRRDLLHRAAAAAAAYDHSHDNPREEADRLAGAA